jgi:Flp pilus assembly protein TadG
MRIASESSSIITEGKTRIEPGSARVRARSRRGDATAGTAMLELAIVVPLFFLMMFAVIDMANLFYAQGTLQDAVRVAGRYAMTGQHQPDGKGGSLSRVASIQQVAQQQALGLIKQPTDVVVSSVTGGSGNAGGPGDTVLVSTTGTVKLITGSWLTKSGSYTFTVSTRFKNESFPPGQQN